MPEELWMEIYDIIQESGIKTITKKKKFQKAKWLSEEALQIAEKRREAKGKGEKERYFHLKEKKKLKKAKWLSEEALQIAEKRREVKDKGKRERYTHLNAEFQRIARRRKPS